MGGDKGRPCINILTEWGRPLTSYWLGPYMATYARLLGKGLSGLPGALPDLPGTLLITGPYLAYLALT